jgi:hypothetical protein
VLRVLRVLRVLVRTAQMELACATYALHRELTLTAELGKGAFGTVMKVGEVFIALS